MAKQYIEKAEKGFIQAKSKVSDLLPLIKAKKDGFVKNGWIMTEESKKRLAYCSNFLHFRDFYKIDKTLLKNANFCKSFKLCPACAKRRAYIQRKDFLEAIKKDKWLLQDNWYYIVLPVLHNKEMSAVEVLEKCKNWLNKIRNYIKLSKRRDWYNSFFSRFDWFVYSFEVTYSVNWYNVHINLMWHTGQNIDIIQKSNTWFNQELSNEWLKATGDSYIVSIQRLDFKSEEDIKKNIMEVFKYCLKNLDMPASKLLEFYKDTPYYRFVWTMGDLYWSKWRLKWFKTEHNDLSDEELYDDAFIDFYRKYSTKRKAYFNIK